MGFVSNPNRKGPVMPNVKLLPPPEQDTQTEVKLTAAEMDADPTQKHLTEQFAGMVKEWHAARKPADINRRPFNRVTVAKTDLTAVKDMIRRAAKKAEHGVRFFQDHRGEDGNVTVKYVPDNPPAKLTPASTDGQGESNG